jgi:hypothetical protein
MASLPVTTIRNYNLLTECVYWLNPIYERQAETRYVLDTLNSRLIAGR